VHYILCYYSTNKRPTRISEFTKSV